MSIRKFNQTQLCQYITALHEAAHAFVAHKSQHWKINDPAVTFPHSSTGHLARAHFGPKVMQARMTKEQSREYVKIAFAGTHGQNLIGEDELLSVLSSPLAGCEDDFSAIQNIADASGIEDEVDNLMQESLQLVSENRQMIHKLAEVIYRAAGNVTRADLMKVLEVDAAPKLVPPQPEPLPDKLTNPNSSFAWFKSIFKRGK